MSLMGNNEETNINIIDTGIVSYNPINGSEAAIIGCREVDKLKEKINAQPLLVEGFAFHKIKMQLAWRMFAYPGDVPVPKELSDVFDIAHEDFNEVAFAAALQNIEKAKAMTLKLKTIAEDLNLKYKALEDFIKQSEVIVSDIIQDEDKGQPDVLRLENNLPIQTVQNHGGRMVEAASKLNFGANKQGTEDGYVNK